MEKESQTKKSLDSTTSWAYWCSLWSIVGWTVKSTPSSFDTTRLTAKRSPSILRSQMRAIQTASTRSHKVSESKHFSINWFNLGGQIYFIKNWHLRQFGFPRTDITKKKFMWKKMNFTTDLPKNNPICSYLVASAKEKSDVGECFRMHVVVNSQEYNGKYRDS